MTVVSKKLGNGIRFCFVKSQSFKITRISVNMAVPLKRKTAARYAVLSSMLTRVCDKYPDITLMNRRLGELYGARVICDVSKLGDSQMLRFGITALDDRFALCGEEISFLCAQLLCEMLTKPLLSNYRFREEDVEREKRILSEEIDAEESDKRLYAQKKCIELMCAGGDYGADRLGTKEDIEALTPQSVFEAWEALLKKSVIQINVIGNCDGDRLAELFENTFAGGVREEPFELETDIFRSLGEVKTLCEKQKLSQSKLVMGYSMELPDDKTDIGAYRVMCDIFGGSPYSKLFTVVREKMSLCYYCSSSLLRDKGIMLVQSGILRKNKEIAIEGIKAQLEAVRNGDFTADDIDSSVKGLSDTLGSIFDSPETIDSWLFMQMKKEKLLMPEDIIKSIQSVTKEKIVEAALKVRLDSVYFLEGEEENADAGNS